ncbi:hypothetical protein ACVWZW_006539 [Bradyrhizobium sp. F1.13.4]
MASITPFIVVAPASTARTTLSIAWSMTSFSAIVLVWIPNAGETANPV